MRYERIKMAHGSGGGLTLELIEEIFAPAFGMGELADAALLEDGSGRMAFTTDGHVVKPPFFPGGDIGRLAVAGTVNDLAVMGARPRYLTAAFIIEEGLAIGDLARIARAMRETADEAGVAIVAGDTKVVERGRGDGVFIATAGVGFVPEGRDVGSHRLVPGDVLLINGTLGDHGMAVLSRREGFELSLALESDVAPLNHLIEEVFAAVGDELHFMRDLTRGGLAAAANEMVRHGPFGVRIHENKVPLQEDVAQYAGMMGIDPLLVANEGKVLFAVTAGAAEEALAVLRRHPLGARAAAIGDLVRQPAGRVVVETPYGSRRLLEMPVEEQLPRIC